MRPRERRFFAPAVLAVCMGAVTADAETKIKDVDAIPVLQAKTSQRVRTLFFEMKGRNKEGWEIADTDNFRLFMKSSPESMKKVASILEEVRANMQTKWLGKIQDPWQLKCEVAIYPDGQSYSRSTGVPEASPGHSRFEMTPQGRVIDRRIYLRGDVPDMHDTVLPHETTHVVLADVCGDKLIPRWLDEGAALLAETADKQEHHRKNLFREQQHYGLFAVKNLLEMKEYPEPGRIHLFYAQSLSLTSFLCTLKDERTVIEFTRDGLKHGYPAAAKKHYGYESLQVLEREWRAAVGKGN